MGLVEGFAKPLSRAYPRATPGTLTEITAAGFTGTGSGRLEAWCPGLGRPVLATTNVSDPVLTQVAGGWRLTAGTDGAYSVTAH